VARSVRIFTGALARDLFHRLPERNQARLRRLAHPVRWGGLRRFEPVDPNWGFGRGTPVDRWYIDRFVAQHAHDVRGRVLEVMAATYADQHADASTRVEILDIDAANPEATILADLADAGSLPRDAFDCVILTQTLQYVEDTDAALANVWQTLAPGGVLLLSVPTISKGPPHWATPDRWRLLPAGLLTTLHRTCPSPECEVMGFGNLVVALAALLGVAAEELRSEELARHDSDFIVITCARVRKPRESALP
jgi:SAM-dependent methyltransferase